MYLAVFLLRIELKPGMDDGFKLEDLVDDKVDLEDRIEFLDKNGFELDMNLDLEIVVMDLEERKGEKEEGEREGDGFMLEDLLLLALTLMRAAVDIFVGITTQFKIEIAFFFCCCYENSI